MMRILPTQLRNFGQGWGTERVTALVRQIQANSAARGASEVHIFQRWVTGKDRKSLMWKRQRAFKAHPNPGEFARFMSSDTDSTVQAAIVNFWKSRKSVGAFAVQRLITQPNGFPTGYGRNSWHAAGLGFIKRGVLGPEPVLLWFEPLAAQAQVLSPRAPAIIKDLAKALRVRQIHVLRGGQ